VIEEGFDVAIRIGELPASSLIARRLADSGLVLVASKGYAETHAMPQSTPDLQKHRLIDLSANASATEWKLSSKDGNETILPVSPRTAISDPGVLLDMIGHGLGIGTVPMIYAISGLQDGSLVRALPELTRGTRPVNAVYPSRRQLAPKVRVFLDFVAESIALMQKQWT
jgi:DNA-binding transcriptional LysR family regulator